MLTPEAAVLGLHSHEHTTNEPAQASANQRSKKAFLTPAHQHCAVTCFYNAPLQFAPCLRLQAPWRQLAYRPYQSAATVGRLFYSAQTPCLRGPPALLISNFLPAAV